MRVLLIGGTNFIGPHVVAVLHRQGHEVTVYHRGLHEPELPSGVRHIHSPHAGVPVLHFPTDLTAPPPDVHFPYRRGAAGTGDWTYHYEKILAERALVESPLPATILRLPAVYGPGDPHHRFRPYIKRMLDGRPQILVDSLQAAWRWTHGYVEDIAVAIASAVTDERAAGKVYNLGEVATPSTAERIRRIGQLMRWNGQVIPLSQERLPPHLQTPYQARQDLVTETRRIRGDLNFRDSIAEDEGLRRTIDWECSVEVPGDPGALEYAAEDAAHLGAA